jgi:hypothetical protein
MPPDSCTVPKYAFGGQKVKVTLKDRTEQLGSIIGDSI